MLIKWGSDQISENNSNKLKTNHVNIEIRPHMEILATAISPIYIFPSALQNSKYYTQNDIAKTVFFVSCYVTEAEQIIETECP